MWWFVPPQKKQMVLHRITQHLWFQPSGYRHFLLYSSKGCRFLLCLSRCCFTSEVAKLFTSVVDDQISQYDSRRPTFYWPEALCSRISCLRIFKTFFPKCYIHTFFRVVFFSSEMNAYGYHHVCVKYYCSQIFLFIDFWLLLLSAIYPLFSWNGMFVPCIFDCNT